MIPKRRNMSLAIEFQLQFHLHKAILRYLGLKYPRKIRPACFAINKETAGIHRNFDIGCTKIYVLLTVHPGTTLGKRPT